MDLRFTALYKPIFLNPKGAFYENELDEINQTCGTLPAVFRRPVQHDIEPYRPDGKRSGAYGRLECFEYAKNLWDHP
jgi:hypothetical protein